MTGRVLSEENDNELCRLADIREYILDRHSTPYFTDDFYDYWLGPTVSDPDCVIDLVKAEIQRLSKKLEDRNKTIEELEKLVSVGGDWAFTSMQLHQQNIILRSVLKQVQWYKDGTGWMRCPVCGWTQDAGHGTDCAIGEALAKLSPDRGDKDEPNRNAQTE